MLSITQAKTGRVLTLPLLPDVADALIAYLRHGRPATTSRHVFVRHRAPFEPFVAENNLATIMRQAPAARLVNTVQDLSARGVGLRVLAGQGAQVDTTTSAGRLVFGIFAALAEFERELIRERTVAGLEAARARGRKGGRKFALSKAQVRLAQSAMAHRDTSVSELCRELGIRPVTLYRYVGPLGQLREQGRKVLGS